MSSIPEAFLDLLTTKKAFAHLATLMKDGTPQVSPIWIDFDGTHVIVNSAVGRQKDKNMRARDKVGLSITDPDNPYRYLGIQGRVVQITEEGADSHIDKMAMKYMGIEKYPHRRNSSEVRCLYKIEPLKVHTMGS
jgi:PPOX class probable F420-dependent enzyme